MSTPLIRPYCTIEIDGETYNVDVGSTAGLDSGRAPYARATIELPIITDAAIEWLDPHDLVRVPVTAGDDEGTPREFDLGLRSRRVDHNAKTVTLELASDEALLQDYATLTTDTGARAFEGSLRDVCDYVLDKIGASLEAGTDDADVTAYWAITNLVTNPTIELDALNWAAGTGASGLVRQLMTVPTAHSGAYALGWTASAGDSNVIPADTPSTTTTYSVTPGKSYVWDFHHVCGTARNVRAAIQWWSANGTVLSGTSFGSTSLGVVNTWGRRTLIAVAPAGASHGVPYVNTLGNSGGELHYIDDAMFYAGDEIIPPFTGDTTDDAAYDYEWSATAHASTSVRTPIVERRPEVYVWKPGVTAWDFLMAITSSAGMILWCDEQRRWFLALPENRNIPTLLSISGTNASEGTDTLSRDDDGAFVSGVVIQYVWTDADDIGREQYDSAGTTDKVVTIKLERPYPGPGAAAAVLARRQGTGRRQDVTAITNWETTPGMTANISLPGAPETTGRIVSVEFDLTEGFMSIGSAGVVDIVPGSIAALTGTIDALAGTIDSL